MSRLVYKISDIWRSIRYFFPTQLLIVHLKFSPVLLFFWIILFGFITRSWGNAFGVPLLFLDPEYLGRVDFFAYLILGISSGAFIMAYHIASYIVNSHRFPFMASLSRPFVKYTFNNSFIPLVFVLVYSYQNIIFQYRNEFISKTDIILNLSGFFIGNGLFYIVSLTYFFRVSKDIFRLFGIDFANKRFNRKIRRVNLSTGEWKRISHLHRSREARHVETYLNHPFSISIARDTWHYDPELINKVFKQNHYSAAIFEIAIIATVISLGLMIDYPWFVIPAAASIFLSLTVILMIASAVHTWTGNWSLIFFIVLGFSINYLSGYEFFGKRNHAYGIQYDSLATIPDSLKYDNIRSRMVQEDTRLGIQRLEKWKKQAFKSKSGKPVLILLNVSGGGMKAALWTFGALQHTDEKAKGRLIQNTHLITGSSGGMIGAGYLRELYLRKKKGSINDFYSRHYALHVAKDLLNPVGFSLAVNDVLFRFKRVQIGNQNHIRDRGYEFEKALHENTEFKMNKTLLDYAQDERNAVIPTMIFSPTIINDGRRLLICSQPMSFLAMNSARRNALYPSIPEDIEFQRFFAKNNALDLRFSSAIRMNATFPYILPSVALPSKPIIEVMDAGFRDNFGLKTSIRFLFQFKEWIAQNTEEVILLQVRENPKSLDLKTPGKSTILELATSPLGNVYENMFRIQDYIHEQLFLYANSWFKGKLRIIEFDLNARTLSEGEQISMSFHLTSLEKKIILEAVENLEKQPAFDNLVKALQ